MKPALLFANSWADQLGRRVVLPAVPQRIVSLVPSQTELLFDLGLGERVVGVTKFCLHPPEARRVATVIGGTKHFDFAKIAALKPDLIIGNKEENYQAGIEELATHYPVWVSDISTLPEALAMIRQVSLLTGTGDRGEHVAAAIAAAFATVVPPQPPISVAYFIWRNPYMVAAAGTFIDDLLQRAGFSNVFAGLARYPAITPEQLAAAAPARIFLASEPYPFRVKHAAELQQICPSATIQLVDGELFSWYGSRLQLAAPYFKRITGQAI